MDMVMLQDLSYSFKPDLPILNSTIEAFVAAIQSQYPDTYFGWASFIDKPIEPFGTWGIRQDYEFKLESALSADPSYIIHAIREKAANSDSLFGGNDIPEAQLDAMLTLCKDKSIGWRNETQLNKRVNKIIVLITDAPYHQVIVTIK
jgi:hypothetical protein